MTPVCPPVSPHLSTWRPAVIFDNLSKRTPPPPGRYNLGVLFQTGRGVAKNPGKGAPMIRKAAVAGVPEAQFTISQWYLIPQLLISQFHNSSVLDCDSSVLDFTIAEGSKGFYRVSMVSIVWATSAVPVCG